MFVYAAFMQISCLHPYYAEERKVSPKRWKSIAIKSVIYNKINDGEQYEPVDITQYLFSHRIVLLSWIINSLSYMLGKCYHVRVAL